MSDRNRGITEGVIWKQLLLFFFPILLGTFFQQLYNTADSMIVGQFVGKEGLAAVGGTTGTLAGLLVNFFVGLSSGATVILSQYYGARDGKNVSRTVHTAIALSIAGGVVLMIVGIAFSPIILRWLNTTEDVLPLAVSYLRIYFCGVIPSLIYNIGAGILRAVGDSKRPLYFLIASCLTNIVLDLLFVAVFGWGVAGAALATIMSQAISALLVIRTLRSASPELQLHAKQIRLHGDLLRRVVHIGLPAGLQSVMYSLSNLIIQSAINTFGTDLMAAFTAYSKLDALFWMISSAFGVTITTFVGQNYGAGKYDRMRKCTRTCLFMHAGTTIAVSALLMLCGRILFHLFTGDETVVQLGIQMQMLIVPFFITYTPVEIFCGTVRGTGDALRPMLMCLAGVCFTRVLWVKLIAPLQPDSFLFMLTCYPISWGLTGFFFTLYYFFGPWKKKIPGFFARKAENAC